MQPPSSPPAASGHLPRTPAERKQDLDDATRNDRNERQGRNHDYRRLGKVVQNWLGSWTASSRLQTTSVVAQAFAPLPTNSSCKLYLLPVSSYSDDDNLRLFSASVFFIYPYPPQSHIKRTLSIYEVICGPDRHCHIERCVIKFINDLIFFEHTRSHMMVMH
ncbi:hypothetical protein GWI33_010245 [Rhynchophorus ferrugineus]|uniref:Uncharacterized protein n=1 Tax=Rhynchophorus ferrugineus TaxID=354439 RepID=A0A834IT79_RHYFE|nr:hypothetical protein GWI33_010245 [Rhynchophorus ferrugineus]